MFKKINTGETRVVFELKNHVIKIPRYAGYSEFYGFLISLLNGWVSNRTEYKWSEHRSISCLGKVRYSFLFSFIIVMDKYEIITEDEFKNTTFDFNFGGYEHKADSIGKDKDGNYVIVDYG